MANLRPTGIPIAGLTAGDIPMSTGYYTGDGRKASHWKDFALIGRYIGIMDTTVALGEPEQLTAADRIAFELLGYQVKPVPAVSSLGGELFNDINADGVHGAAKAVLQAGLFTSIPTATARSIPGAEHYHQRLRLLLHLQPAARDLPRA